MQKVMFRFGCNLCKKIYKLSFNTDITPLISLEKEISEYSLSNQTELIKKCGLTKEYLKCILTELEYDLMLSFIYNYEDYKHDISCKRLVS